MNIENDGMLETSKGAMELHGMKKAHATSRARSNIPYRTKSLEEKLIARGGKRSLLDS